MAFSPLDGGCGGREMAVEDFEMFTGSFWGANIMQKLEKMRGLNGCLIRDVSKYVHLRHLPGTTFIPVKFLKIEISSAKSTATLLDVLVVCL